MSKRETGEIKTIVAAVGTVLFAILVAFALFFLSLTFYGRSPLLSSILIYVLFGIGLSQLLYVIPVVLLLKRRQQFALVKGMVIGAAIVFFVSGGCFVLFFWPLR